MLQISNLRHKPSAHAAIFLLAWVIFFLGLAASYIYLVTASTPHHIFTPIALYLASRYTNTAQRPRECIRRRFVCGATSELKREVTPALKPAADRAKASELHLQEGALAAEFCPGIRIS